MARIGLALLGLAAVGTAVVVTLRDQLVCEVGGVQVTQLKLRQVHQSLLVFEARHGRFPTDEEGLELLVEEGLLADADDPWGHPLNYTVQPGDAEAFELWSGGADGRPGGDADDADVFLDG